MSHVLKGFHQFVWSHFFLDLGDQTYEMYLSMEMVIVNLNGSKLMKSYDFSYDFSFDIFFLPGWRSSLELSRFSAAGRHPQSMRTPPGAAPGASTPNEEAQSGRFLGL